MAAKGTKSSSVRAAADNLKRFARKAGLAISIECGGNVVQLTGKQAEAFSPAETGEHVAAAELRSFIERIERVDEEKKAITDDRRDILLEAKSRGFSTRAIKEIVRLRAMEPHEREEQQAILDLYKSALGMA